MTPRLRWIPVAGLTFLVLAALVMTWRNLNGVLPFSDWAEAMRSPDPDQIRSMLFYYSALPRLTMALLVGAGSGLCGVLFQQVLRNPLAESTTLGVASGAQLGLTVTTLWALPGGLLTQQFAALTGALTAGLLVFGVAWGKRLSPVTLILAGLVVSFYCSALNQLLALFHREQLHSLFLWSTGSLTQTDWQSVSELWPRLLGGAVLALLLLRPLTLMGLDDGVARNLGLGLSTARLAALGLAIVVSALLVNAVGLIGFIGLFSPMLAKMLGARRLMMRMLLSALLGALILWLSDEVVLWLANVWPEMSTGTMTALLGAPLLLWLLPRLRTLQTPDSGLQRQATRECRQVKVSILIGLLLLAVVIIVALSLGRGMMGWQWVQGAQWQALLPWRWPRVVAALSAGVMLGVAGCFIQRLTGNAMASPEVLGISSGAAFGVAIMLFAVPGDAFSWLLPAGSLGAAFTLTIIMVATGRGGFSPQRMLLAGMALSTAFSMLLMLLLASGDPRMARLLTWLGGSTYSVTGEQAWRTLSLMVVLVSLVPLCRRWLHILPLGGVTAKAVGIALTPARLALLALAATLTAAATLIVGPLSFVGLMAPHIARMIGFRQAMSQAVLAGIIGGGLMITADWCGRMIAFPNQIPAGLLATVIGAPYFIWLLRRQVR